MNSRRNETRGIFLLLLSFLAVFAAVDLLTLDDGIRLAPFTTLAPFVAGALLSLRLTATICGLCLTLIAVEYGFVIPNVSGHNKAIIIASAAAACMVSMVVCRARLHREKRTEDLRITAEAAQRLLPYRLLAMAYCAGEASTASTLAPWGIFVGVAVPTAYAVGRLTWVARGLPTPWSDYERWRDRDHRDYWR